MTASPLSYGPFISLNQAKAQGIKLYSTGEPCRHGHTGARRVSSRACCECERIKALERRNQNPEAWNARARQWKQANKAKVSAYNKTYGLNHRDEINTRIRDQYASDPNYTVAMRLRARLYEMVTKAGAAKTGKFRELVDVSREQLLAHLESQFAPGMSWENMGQWHIDHIRPCASFDLTDPAQQRECFHYSNLQPLWAEDNWQKSDKWEPVAA